MKRLSRRYRAVMLLAIPVAMSLMVSCGGDDDTAAVIPVPVATGTFTDSRDGEQYGWVEYGGLQWMTENYRYDTGDYSTCRNYIDDNDWIDYAQRQTSTRNRAKYGMYYTLSGARAACPDGWRLPTDDDWKSLEEATGMSRKDVGRTGWRGSSAWSLLATKEHDSYARMLLGGYVTYHTYTNLRNFSRLKGAWGFYWTSTLDPDKEGDFYYYRKFAYNRDGVCRESMEPEGQMLSVRYVRDAGQ